jgi:hypothetical protein
MCFWKQMERGSNNWWGNINNLKNGFGVFTMMRHWWKENQSLKMKLKCATQLMGYTWSSRIYCSHFRTCSYWQYFQYYYTGYIYHSVVITIIMRKHMLIGITFNNKQKLFLILPNAQAKPSGLSQSCWKMQTDIPHMSVTWKMVEYLFHIPFRINCAHKEICSIYSICTHTAHYTNFRSSVVESHILVTCCSVLHQKKAG